ncbi:MAG: PP2C family protein-serine/threonine phosphatase [Jhaorihella sp.]
MSDDWLEALKVTIGWQATSRPGLDGGAIRRVLVVDDSRLQRRILAGLLVRWGFEVLEADCGARALELCATAQPDLILSDWMMPGMTGLDFCRAFRGLPAESYGYFILLTSKSEKGEIAQGLDAGADDFLTKPVNPDELRARIAAGARILAMHRELAAQNRAVSDTLAELQAVHARIDQDLIQARKTQESLVPEFSRSFGASRFSLLLKPCGYVGGDLVGLFSPGLNRVGFYSIDVSGHGITSALMTARLAGYLSGTHFDQNIAMEQRQYDFYGLRPPGDVAETLNARLMADTGIDEYFTMVYATADLYTGRVAMVQCGHPHPLILRADGTAEFMGAGGMPIGLLPQLSCDRFETRLFPGDRLLLYSDGFTECRTGNGDMLESEGLLELIRDCRGHRTGGELLDDLFERLTRAMPEGQGLDDDVSAILLEYAGV